MTGQGVAEDILSGNRRTAARLITRIEAGDPSVRTILETLYRSGGRARVVGVTGPPGAGKSTLVDGLVAHWRAEGRTVAVLAVDPSSPISGGAVLGDRVRMGRHAGDEGVLIRSMAARGALGGLADACGDALTVLDALGFDRIVLETVGVGQSEVDVLTHAHGVVVLQTPEGGDGIQSVKAGVLEVADILVVNKADIPGVERMLRHLRDMVAHRMPALPGWDIPVITTEANRGEGIDDLATAIEAFLAAFDASPAEGRQARAVQQTTLRVTALARNLMRRYLEDIRHDATFEELMAATAAHRTDPHAAARAIIVQAVERGLPA
jgi:LAO/AO transport system kinase